MLLTEIVVAGVSQRVRYDAVEMEMEDERGQGETEERRLFTARSRGRDQSPLTELNSRYLKDEKVRRISTEHKDRSPRSSQLHQFAKVLPVDLAVSLLLRPLVGR